MVQHKQAFTLIELLVVVLIIGILAALAVPQYQMAVLKSRYVQLETLGRTIWRAQKVYYLANGSYSPDLEGLDISIPGINIDTRNASGTGYQCESYPSEIYCYDVSNNGGFHIYLDGRMACYVNTVAHQVEAWRKLCSSLTGNEGARWWGILERYEYPYPIQ